MAEEKVEAREITWRQLFPWTELFRGFQVALDLNKLLLAAAGIVVMWFGWWLLSVTFAAVTYGSSPIPDWPGTYGDKDATWPEFRRDRLHWNLMHESAGLTAAPMQYEVKDIAETRDEYELFKGLDRLREAPEQVAPGSPARTPAQAFLDLVSDYEKKKTVIIKGDDGEPKKIEFTPDLARRYRAKASQYARLGREKPAARLRIDPWSEDRGPNPYLLVTGQAGIPWAPGYFWEWFSRDQVPVMIEPLIKFVRPIIYFFSPVNTFASRFYFLCVTLFTLLVWSVFGGAITRIAAVQLARGEKIGLFEALRFTLRRIQSYIFAPLFPLGFVFFLVIILAIFGLLGMIPFVGDIFIEGLFWPIPMIFGLVMAVALVGLVGWPLMAATISTEGTDSWEAVSRSYSYVYQRPWQYIWYSLVAIAYGGICVFFVGFMASFTVYLAKWGVSQAPFSGPKYADREPNYLFIYAPTSFGWRELLLEGTHTASGADVVQSRTARPLEAVGTTGGISRWDRINHQALAEYKEKDLRFYHKWGAGFVAFWLGVVFLLVLGFGYSYFWTASTIIYLLLRKSVDAAELDEVYLEEDDYEPSFGTTPTSAPAPAPAPAPTPGRSLPLVDVQRPAPTPAPAPAPAPAPTPAPAPAAVTPPPLPTPAPPPLPPEKKTEVAGTSEPASSEPAGPAADQHKPPAT